MTQNEKDDPKLTVERKFSDVKNQYIAVLIVNLITVSYGALVGWVSPTVLILQSENSPFAAPITNDQMSWLGSLLMLGGVAGTMLFTLIKTYFGRKTSLITLSVPVIISWIMVLVVPSVEYLYAARFIAGLTYGGVFVVVPLYISEVACDHVRGSLGSLFIMAINFGNMFSFIVAPYVSYYVFPYIILTFPILFLIGSIFLPELPIYLVSCGKMKEAEKSIRFYKNCYDDSNPQTAERFNNEMKKIVDFVNKAKEAEQITFKDFLNPQARRGLLLASTVCFIFIFAGPFAITNYAATFFEESGSTFDPNLSAIIMVCSQISGIYVAILIADKFGRRTLMAYSLVGGAAGLTVFGLFSYLFKQGVDMSAFNWVPVTSVSVSLFCYSLGLLSLNITIQAEVMPAKIRSYGLSFTMLQMCLSLFLLTKLLPILFPIVGLHFCMWFFALVSFLGILFALLILPETNGKNINV